MKTLAIKRKLDQVEKDPLAIDEGPSSLNVMRLNQQPAHNTIQYTANFYSQDSSFNE